ncbi:MAG: 16S rRNA methyltransferase [Idiomarinaceae bacterium]|nr:16S rRNA methyltransferase [Idiomarinaceae bacterium]HAD48124.1 16S rRNA methyltransferase [Idiomarina sp.]
MSVGFELQQTDNGLALVWLDEPGFQPLIIDFHKGKSAYRAQHSALKSEAIARAIGITGKRQPSVIDATAGLARDAMVMAGFGCQVSLIERQPYVRALLNDALARAQAKSDAIGEAAKRLNLLDVSSINEVEHNAADVVYLDPMYPKTGKRKAQVKKDMQMFQQLVGSDLDADDLLQPALSVARYRVVVKRPNSAPFLNGNEPNQQLTSKKHRFDIYINQGFDK